MAQVRTFIAVEATDKVKRRALDLIEKLRLADANVKWVDLAHMHWTLKFLGNVDSHTIPKIYEAMELAAAAVGPFAIEAQGAGAFPAARRPRTVWLGVGEGKEEFVVLHAALEDSLAKLGFRQEQRRFQPHLTLGRVRRSPMGVQQLGQLVTEQAGFEAGRMTVRELVLFSSEMDRQGPVYQVLARAGLEA